jgi:hypothetical protein
MDGLFSLKLAVFKLLTQKIAIWVCQLSELNYQLTSLVLMQGQTLEMSTFLGLN